jgi:hypothetical protein
MNWLCVTSRLCAFVVQKEMNRSPMGKKNGARIEIQPRF